MTTRTRTAPPTSAPSAPGTPTRRMHPLRVRTLTVVGVERLAARMVRVRLHGDDVADLPTASATDHVKLFVPTEPGTEPALPVVVDDRWVSGRDLPSRDYTIRAIDREARTLDIDLVEHPHGIVGRWASSVQLGDRVGVLGPRGSVLPPEADWYLLAVDETGLPAAARWLHELTPGARVLVVVEVQDAEDVLPLPTDAHADVTWLFRGERAPGTTSLLADTVRDLELPDGDGYVWVAGEAGAVRPLRRYLRDDLGLPRDAVDVDGYWRRGVAGHDHHEDDDS